MVRGDHGESQPGVALWCKVCGAVGEVGRVMVSPQSCLLLLTAWAASGSLPLSLRIKEVPSSKEVDVGSQERSLKLFLSDFAVVGEEDSGKGSSLVGRGRLKVHQRELRSETLVL